MRQMKEEGASALSGSSITQPARSRISSASSKPSPASILSNAGTRWRSEWPSSNCCSVVAARGVAVIVNQPLGQGSRLSRVRDRPLPDWAGEIDCTSWAQLLLTYILAQPAVTCVIPATCNPEQHMKDDLAAGFGRLLRRDLAKYPVWPAGPAGGSRARRPLSRVAARRLDHRPEHRRRGRPEML